MKPAKQFHVIKWMLAPFDAGLITERELSRGLAHYLARRKHV